MIITYFGILSDFNIIEDKSLQTIANIQDVVYILKREHENSTSSMKFTVIDKDGNDLQLIEGNFQVLHIGEDGKWAGAGRRTITIKDLRTGQVFQTDTTKMDYTFFCGELLPLLKDLNEVGSWKMHQKLQELAEAHKEIGQLKSTIKSLEAKLTDC